MVENKFPGKDVSDEDLETKFPLVAKQNQDHRSSFDICGVTFGGGSYPNICWP